MKKDLIFEISRQLNNVQVSDRKSLCKAIYSATGKMSLISLWDHSEDEEFVSIQHFKRRAAQILDAYITIYPQTKALFPEDRTGIIDEIYETYRRNGFFYHSPHRLSPAAPSVGSSGHYVLYRGISPEQKSFMSGLGLYGIKQNVHPGKTAAKVFDMQTQQFSEYLQEVLNSNNWREIDWPEDSEFLRLDPPFTAGYWQSKPEKTNRISMARYGAPNKLYVLYRWQHGQFQQKPIPAWRVDDFRTIGQSGYGEYRRIACALLDAAQQLPPIIVTPKDSIIVIKLGYRLPPAEEDFFKLYSWPINYDITQKSPQVFQREMSVIVYSVLRQHLESIGYRFVEE